ncbi:hypothetical protein BDZ45DRAFT_731740 [Acephala macrosclerotiorum]|nr:hypothetical protein BDZ45DRAFT_731740 [Acephala macrosclerotiorum]
MYGMACETPTPSTLLACRESHTVTLSMSQAHFNFELDALWIQHNHTYWHFRNNGVESIFVVLWDGFSSEDFENLGRVERLAVLLPDDFDYDYDNIDNFDEKTVLEILRFFSGVKHLFLVKVCHLMIKRSLFSSNRSTQGELWMNGIIVIPSETQFKANAKCLGYPRWII